MPEKQKQQEQYDPNNQLTIDEIQESIYEVKKDIDDKLRLHNLLVKVRTVMTQLIAQQQQAQQQQQMQVVESTPQVETLTEG